MKKTFKLMVLTVPPNTLGGVEFATNDIFHSLERVHRIKINYLRSYGSKSTSGSLATKAIKRMFTFREIIVETKKFKPDIVHINSSLTARALIRDWFVARFFKSRRIPIFLWFHGSNYNILRNMFNRAIFNSIIDKVGYAVVLSNAELINIKKFAKQKNKIIKIDYFVDIKRMKKLARNTKFKEKLENPNILFAGRFILKKGVLDTVEAFNLLKNKFPHLRLILAGDGPLRGDIDKLIKKFSLENKVLMTGHVSEDKMKKIYNSSTVFVLPTFHPEGMPGGIINALVFGLPIITTKTRGMADFLKNNINCLFVPPKNPKTLSRRLEEMLNNAKLQNSMKKNNLLLADKFDINSHRDYFFNIYQKILNEYK